MTKQLLLDRIVINEKILAGKPVIKGTRLSVDHVLNLLAHGMTEKEIIAEYPGLTGDDMKACYLFAAESIADASFVPVVEAV